MENTLKGMYADLTDAELMERYEQACGLAAKQYAAHEDTTLLDSMCDDMQSELERRGF